MKQEQFLNVIDRDEAERRFRAVIALEPLGVECVPLTSALGRVLAEDVVAALDVPSFDRSNYDGYAVRSVDTYGAIEESPCSLRLLDEAVSTGVRPRGEVRSGEAMSIATGGMIPRGADAVVMIEHAEAEGAELLVRKSVSPAFGVAFAGMDVAAGETILRGGVTLTSRETGVLAAVGRAEVPVFRQPRVAIISTGDEIIAPGEPMAPALVYDSNGQILADAVRELGGLPLRLGIVRDDADALREKLRQGLSEADVVLLSGGTSKGQGDLCYRVVAEIDNPGIVAHGVALKPGKPICLAASAGKPVVILPGFPTSAVFTFHEFVAPVVRLLAGRAAETARTIDARIAVKVNSEIGRTEYLLVGLIDAANGISAYPMGKGSGSVTTFSQADGFVTIDRHTEILSAGAAVQVQPIGQRTRPADLATIGSHCVGLDYLLSQMQRQGFQVKQFTVGSSAGLEAARRGECDLAGIHLLDPQTGEYNRPFLKGDLELLPGYGRSQGIVYRTGDDRFAGQSLEQILTGAIHEPGCQMVNRNQGSGTRIFIEQLLRGSPEKPSGYAVQAKSHNAVAAAIVQQRADWGVAIESVARAAQLAFTPLQDEQFDFVIPTSRYDRPAVQAFRKLLAKQETQAELNRLGLKLGSVSWQSAVGSRQRTENF